MAILIIAEHDNKTLKSATLNTITAASQLGNDIDVLVAGYDCQVVADKLSTVVNVNKVLLADNPNYEHQLAENVSQLVVALANNYTHIMTCSTASGKNFMPRVAALLDVAQISDIISVESQDTFLRPVYAGNAIAKIKSLDPIKVITVRSTAFDAALIGDTNVAVEEVTLNIANENTTFISEHLCESDRPELTDANVIVSGGRGMGNGDNFALLEQVADKLNGAVGASRAAVDAGYVANDMQVGQTGKIVAPDLYIAVGISGAIQHLAGMKDSKVIVAINKDEEAPIFQVADYGLVADLFDVLPELAEKL
ncbi:electron transfer flavoprotein subunit alpha/FixB family protein [Thalassotalea piscium]